MHRQGCLFVQIDIPVFQLGPGRYPSGEGQALGGVATFGYGNVASLASFNSFDVHLMF